MRGILYHFSEEPDITRFEPRLPTSASGAPAEPTVWAIDEEHEHNYLLPRDCPRVTFYAAPTSTPGDVAQGLLEENGLTQTELAARLGVSRATVYELLRGKRALTPDMAHRLGRFFGNGPGVWLRMQATVDLWDALHMDTVTYEDIEPLPHTQLQAA